MLSKSMVIATLGVKDMKRAREFYENELGLEEAMGGGDMVMYACGEGTALSIYTTELAGTNKATAASWKVDDLEAEMKALRDKGVVFEEYDMNDFKTVNGVATWESEGKSGKAAWFKDPDGNILCLNEM